ncbi:MAG: hypothetical protein WCG91_03110 [Candidatus Shapirobacteria bacterium]
MIIFINGSINSGKSTIAKLLAKKIGNCAILEIDRFHEFLDWMPIGEIIPINLKNAVSLVKNYVELGFNVIVPYPLSLENYDYLMENLKDLKDEISVFTLAPKIEKALTNRGTRELNELEIKRIKYHYGIGIHKPSFGEIIDNTNQSPEETLKIILDKIV